MPDSTTLIREKLRTCSLTALFIEELGWNHHRSAPLIVENDGINYTLNVVAEKHGMVAYECQSGPKGEIPDYPIRGKIERQVAKSAHEHIVVFVNQDRTTQTWQWVRREKGKPTARREHTYASTQTGDLLLQKLQILIVSLEEEENLTIVEVAGKVKKAFNVEHVTKRFYDRFQKEHSAFLEFIEGVTVLADREWYASLMLNRLMFIYFIQKKNFLDGNADYLRNRLHTVRQSQGQGKFHSFYRQFLRRLFHEGLAQRQESRSPELITLLGNVPYLNGGLFDTHQLEIENPDIHIPDEAFEKLFDFFDEYQWHLDERPTRADNEINPDVLGYIFEKYINQKQMGAYYTKEDITEYISKSTIVPFLFDAAEKKCSIAFRPDGAVWRLLRDDPNRYIYDAVKKGVDIQLPEDIAAGVTDVSKRGGWNRPADNDFALPTETWREHIARRNRCIELRGKMAAGEVHSINDLITFNLDLRQFAQDVIETCEGPELLRAFYKSIEEMSILDPTCGSGAFLFAALNILEPLYEACLDRMEVFVEELDKSGEKHHPEKYSDFRKVLEHANDQKKHPSRRYFILKSIVLRNIYGVDIMAEAVEICKLRLFLKLVAQVQRVEDVEPLPDIDFNIRTGNTLVGFTSLDDVRQAMTITVKGQHRLPSDEDRINSNRIGEDAEWADMAFEEFRRQQSEFGMQPNQYSAAKDELQTRLKKLRTELDSYLAAEYGIDSKKSTDFQRWQLSYQPFHWFVEFYGIMAADGFDVVIGNPPYLDLTQLEAYEPKNYTTLPTKNLYSLLLERCKALVKERQGYIVPISSISTEGYSELQRILLKGNLWFVSFDDRPAHLFDGLDKNTLSILLLSRMQMPQTVASSRLNRWNAEERRFLFPRLHFHPTPSCSLPGCLPRIGSEMEFVIWQKVFRKTEKLSSAYAPLGNATTYYSRKVNAFLQILDFIPQVRDGRGRLRPPSEFKSLTFSESWHSAAVFCLFNSTLFRWFMDVVSDGSHLNKREIDNFPFDPRSANEYIDYFNKLATVLSTDLKKNSVEKKMTYSHDTLTVQCIVPKFSKTILDEIDRTLAKHYNFTEEEVDFIINYDIKYRLGTDSDAEDE